MSSADLSFQEVIAAELEAALPAVAQGSNPPGDIPLPYIQFGQSEIADDFPLGHVVLIMVHTWDNSEGPHGVKNMQGPIREALHAKSFIQNEWAFSCVREESARVILDANNETWHGIQRFRALASLT